MFHKQGVSEIEILTVSKGNPSQDSSDTHRHVSLRPLRAPNILQCDEYQTSSNSYGEVPHRDGRDSSTPQPPSTQGVHEKFSTALKQTCHTKQHSLES